MILAEIVLFIGIVVSFMDGSKKIFMKYNLFRKNEYIYRHRVPVKEIKFQILNHSNQRVVGLLKKNLIFRRISNFLLLSALFIYLVKDFF